MKIIDFDNFWWGEVEVLDKHFFIPQRSQDKKQSFWTSGDASAFFGSLTVVFSLFAESTYPEIPGDLPQLPHVKL